MRTVPSSFQTGPQEIMYRHGHEEPKRNLSASARLNHYHSSERWQCLSREFCVLFSSLTKLFRRTLVHINTNISGEELPSRYNICSVFEGGLEEENVLSISLTEDRGVEARSMVS